LKNTFLRFSKTKAQFLFLKLLQKNLEIGCYRGVGEYDAFLPQHPTDKNYWEPENLKQHCYRIDDRPYLLITEGPFKAISGCSNGLPTIALMGISMGLTAKASDLQNKRYLVPALESYACAGFGFIIAFDADAATNKSVIWEQRKLGRQLLKFGVPVRSVTATRNRRGNLRAFRDG